MRTGTEERKPTKDEEGEPDSGKKEERELLNEKEAEKAALTSEAQILSPLRFNMPFNYLTVHLCKHPHPQLPEPETHMHRQTDRHKDTHAVIHVHRLLC